MTQGALEQESVQHYFPNGEASAASGFPSGMLWG